MECCSMKPIGYVSSLFTYKNGTPRQPSLCETARGTITISKDIFNCPEHSLQGLEQYSHIWVIFIFHKNNNQYTKAKVKPPRLDGKRVGLYSTRSPYRPNPVGLTLARLERVEGAKLYLSGIDILDGSPVIDIKPYIPSYDRPPQLDTVSSARVVSSDCASEAAGISGIEDSVSCDHSINSLNTESTPTDVTSNVCFTPENINSNSHDEDRQETKSCNLNKHCDTINNANEETAQQSDVNNVNDMLVSVNPRRETSLISDPEQHTPVVSEVCPSQDDQQTSKSESRRSLDQVDQQISTATWVHSPPINKLQVRFTESARKQMENFKQDAQDSDYKLNFLSSSEEIEQTICQILREDPRSVYRRNNCCDSLYYFVVDVVHVTCWFDDNLSEVVRVKPVSQVKHLQTHR